jgi:hypothetical protein
VAAKELNIVKSLDQPGKQRIKFLPGIVMPLDSGIGQATAYNQDPAPDRG